MAAKRPGTGSGKRPVHHPESTARITEARPQFNGRGPWCRLGRIQGSAAPGGPQSANLALPACSLRAAKIRLCGSGLDVAGVQKRAGTYISGGIGPR